MRQMLEQSHSLPKGVTTDYPVYPMRGFMLDVGHKYSSSDNAIFYLADTSEGEFDP